MNPMRSLVATLFAGSGWGLPAALVVGLYMLSRTAARSPESPGASGAVATEAGAVATEAGAVATEAGAVATEGEAVATECEAVATEAGAVATEAGAVATEAGAVPSPAEHANGEPVTAEAAEALEEAQPVSAPATVVATRGRAPRPSTSRAAAGKRTQSRAGAVAPPASGSQSQESARIRSWARSKGLHVSGRGRIPQSVVAAYEQAHRTPKA